MKDFHLVLAFMFGMSIIGSCTSQDPEKRPLSPPIITEVRPYEEPKPVPVVKRKARPCIFKEPDLGSWCQYDDKGQMKIGKKGIKPYEDMEVIRKR